MPQTDADRVAATCRPTPVLPFGQKKSVEACPAKGNEAGSAWVCG